MEKTFNFTADFKLYTEYMKYLIFILLIPVTFPKITSAQKIELINSAEVIKKCAMLYDSGQYKSALTELKKVNRSDTNYVWSLYEKSIDCEADSQYNQAIKYCQEGLSLNEQREYEPELYNTYGNTLDDMGQPEKAIKVFDLAISKYPAYSLLYFNKGIALLALKRSNDAEIMFKKTLMINPYMYSAHYQLGIAALQQGKIIPSFLSLIGYLLVNPSGKYWSKSIKLLDQISKSTDEILEYKNKRATAPGESFQEVEDIVLSKIALDKGYRPIIALDDAISRQIQAVFEKLEYKDTEDDFWIQYYLPYFKQVYNNGKFELFINHIFSNVNIPIIQDYNKKNKKELGEFSTGAAEYFDLLRATRELFYKKRDSITERYLFEDGKLMGKGVLANKGKTLTGRWEFYYPAGNLKCVGNYNLAGQREGKWIYYFYDLKLKAKEAYTNGKLEGVQEYYFENGNLSSVENYRNNKAEGLVTTYFYAGNKKSAANYKDGKKEGEERRFYANGNLKTVNNYSNDLLTGVSHEYYKSGKIKEVEQYNNGKGEGPYKSYSENGELATEGQYMKDNAEGEFKYYFENGKIQEKRNYVNNIEEGAHEEYYENGQPSVTYLSKKGKVNGEAVYYDKDGKMFSKYIYDNGIIKSAKYFNKSGNQISSSMSNDIITYTPDGLKKAHSSYDQKGNLEGPDTLFYPSGEINQVNMYKNGELNGNSVTYYLNGKEKSEINMTDGKDSGLYVSYYVNGKPETEGWFVDGEYKGEWRFYDELGRVSTISYYLDGDLDGYKEEYLANGQKTTEQKYHLGWLEKLTQYDDAGNVLVVDSFPKASGNYKLIYPGGKIMTQVDYVNGDFNGPYKTYYFDGSLETSYFYNKGARDSTYVSYYYGGQKSSEGHYLADNKSGTWKFYDEDGKLSNTTEYADDEMNGEKIDYFKNGNKDRVSIYKDDLLNGPVKKYDPDGALAYQVVFENDNAETYSYLGKDDKLLPPIAIDSKNGVLKAYFSNGKLSRECEYRDGKINGPDLLYYDNGQLRSSDTSSYGVSNGITKEYYKDGKIKSIYRYSIDNADGVCSEFDSNGVLKKEVTYENGINDGSAKYYENGKPVKKLMYHYGMLISATNEK